MQMSGFGVFSDFAISKAPTDNNISTNRSVFWVLEFLAISPARPTQHRHAWKFFPTMRPRPCVFRFWQFSRPILFYTLVFSLGFGCLESCDSPANPFSTIWPILWVFEFLGFSFFGPLWISHSARFYDVGGIREKPPIQPGSFCTRQLAPPSKKIYPRWPLPPISTAQDQSLVTRTGLFGLHFSELNRAFALKNSKSTHMPYVIKADVRPSCRNPISYHKNVGPSYL